MDGWMDGRMDRQTLFYRTLTAEGRGSKRKKVFSLINAGWIVSRILYIFFNVNQINQLYLSNNEASCHHIYVNDTHREMFYSIQYRNLLKQKLGYIMHFSYIHKIISINEQMQCCSNWGEGPGLPSKIFFGGFSFFIQINGLIDTQIIVGLEKLP